MSSHGIIDIDGTDSNGNTGMTVRVTDKNGVLLENIKITGENAENEWTQVSIQGKPNESNSITAYKSGRTCILKGINITSKVGYPTGANYGWYAMANFDNMGKQKSLFQPSQKTYWYQEIILLQQITLRVDKAKTDTDGNITGWDSNVTQKINNPYSMSFLLTPSGELYNRLERQDLTTNSTVSNINFTLIYLV